MIKLKKIGMRLLFPPMAVLWILLSPSLILMIYGMWELGEKHPATIIGYVLSFYMLTVWCVRIPQIILFFNNIKKENKYVRRWLEDTRLRINITLTGNVIWNVAYAALQFFLGICTHSVWFFSLSGYYLTLGLMRLFLVLHTAKHRPGEQIRREWKIYRKCGWAFLATNLTLTAMMFYMIYENHTVQYHEITTIAMAAYTFISLTMAIINVVRYRKYKSPVFSASKSVSLAAACVSVITLEDTMLATFSKDTMTEQTQRLFLALSGGVVSVFVVVTAIYMIVRSNKILKCLEKRNGE